MTAAALIALGQSLLGAIPKIIELVKQGREAGSISLSEIISTDALATLEESKAIASDFENS